MLDKQAFWDLLAEAKSRCGKDVRTEEAWLLDKLQSMPAENSLCFHHLVCRYSDLACRYGLWSAASILTHGCTDDDFLDFRGWLIAQGKDAYLLALEDPDSLAEAEPYCHCYFEGLNYVGNIAYNKLTGRSAYNADIPYDLYMELIDLGDDIQYSPIIDCPLELDQLETYLPRLFARYMDPEWTAIQVARGIKTWNMEAMSQKKMRIGRLPDPAKKTS